MYQLAVEIKQHARQIGFDLVGIAPAGPSKYRQYLRDWLDSGQAGEMEYLKRRFDERVDPAMYMPGARSVICVAMNYHIPLAKPLRGEEKELSHEDTKERRKHEADTGQNPLSSSSCSPSSLRAFVAPSSASARISRYALGDDYHELIQDRLHKLADWIRQRAPDTKTRCAVDTAPVMEKELAARAGVGWMGKNTCIINEKIGSWLLLGEIITTLDLPMDEPGVDRCGTCRRCIDACPTQAITAPYQLDARRCISYLTIEHRDDIPRELQQKIGDWLYGCDICQDVCPWNDRAVAATDPALQPRFQTGRIDPREVLRWTDEDYCNRLRGSAMKRIKLPVLQRNAQIVLNNLYP